MAAALWERAGGEARARGLEPAPGVYPEVVEAMREVGIDVSSVVPRPLENADLSWADSVVTIDCEGVSPPPRAGHHKWSISAGQEDPLARTRDIRDQLAVQIRRLAEEVIGR
jgi:arsenate reductase (thioredoxin)